MEKEQNKDETEVWFIRLTTGEDIVAEVMESDKDTIILINPCKVLYTTSMKPGYLSISLMQWVFTKIADVQMFEMNRSNILLTSQPNPKLFDYYWQTVNHFQAVSNELSNRTEYVGEDDADDATSEDFTTEESKEALDMLTKLLESFGKPDKDKLH